MKMVETGNQDLQALRTTEMGPLLDAEVTAGSGTSEQKTWRLVRPVTLIGFTQHAHIRIEGLGVESVHAALLNTGEAIVLADLISRQGVYCGTQRIRTRVLQPGESFRLGTCLLRLDFERSARSPVLDAGQILQLPQRVRLATVQGETQEWTTDAIAAVIGSRPGCDVRLASKDVLPLHALLTRVGPQIVLASLAADKPIRVNGTPSNMSVVQGGDTLTIWPITLQLTLGRNEATQPTQQPRLVDMQEQPDMVQISKPQPVSKDSPIAKVEAISPLPADVLGAALVSGSDALPLAPAGEIPDLGSRLVQMEEQLRDSSRQLRQWQAQLEQYANGLIRRDAELTKRSSQLDELQGRLQASEGRIQKRSEELDKTQADLDAERNSLQRQHAALAQEHSRLQGRIREFETQRETLQEVEAQRQKIDEQAEQVERARAELKDSHNTLLAEREDLARREARLTARSQVIDRFGQVLADARLQFNDVISESPEATS